MRTIEERLADYAHDLEHATTPDAGRAETTSLPRRTLARRWAMASIAAATVAAIAAATYMASVHSDTTANDRSPLTPEPSLSLLAVPEETWLIEVGEPTVFAQWYNAIIEGDTPTALAARFGITVEQLASANGWADGADHALEIGDTVHIPAGALAVAEALAGGVSQGDYSIGVSNDGLTICLLYRTEISGCDGTRPDTGLTVLSASDYDTETQVIYGITTATDIRLKGSEGTSIPLPVSGRVNGQLTFINTSLPLDFRGTLTAQDGEEVVGAYHWTGIAGSSAGLPCADATYTTYTVQMGDSPRRVAEKFGVTLAELGAANIDTEGYRNFVAGIEINIPTCTPSPTTAAG